MNIGISLPRVPGSQRSSPAPQMSKETRLPSIQRKPKLLFRSETGTTSENPVQEDLLEQDHENLLSLVFGSIDNEQQETITRARPEAEMAILKNVAIEECFKIVLCFDKRANTYQHWKKYKPKYLKMAIYEKQVTEQALAYKSKNKFDWLPRMDHNVAQETLNEEIHQMLASQVNVQLVNPLIDQQSKFPNLQVLIFSGGICNYMDFALSRASLRRDPFSLSEATYTFWFLVYALFQLDKADVYHDNLHPRNILLESMAMFFQALERVGSDCDYELRLFNLVTRMEDITPSIYDRLVDIFATMLELYGYKQPPKLDILGQNTQYVNTILEQFPSLVEVKQYLMNIYTAEDRESVVKQFKLVYPKKFVSTVKRITDKDQIIKEYELELWQVYFKQRGLTKFDAQTLVDLGLVDIQRKVRIHISNVKYMHKEERWYPFTLTCFSQEILNAVLDPLVKSFTRKEFMDILDRLKQAQKGKDYSQMVECYVAQSRFYYQMGELKTSIGVLELAERMLVNVVGERYFQRCLDVYERQACLYLELGQYDRALDKQKLAMQLILRLKAAHNQHLKNAMVLLYCQILDAKGSTDQAIQELYNIIFKLEQKEEKLSQKASKHVESKKRKMQLVNYYDTLCQMYWKKEMFKLCLSYQEKSLDVKEQYLHSVHPEVTYSQRFLGQILAKLNKEKSRQADLSIQSQQSIQSMRTFFYLCLNDVDRLVESMNMTSIVPDDLIRHLTKQRPGGDVFDPIYRKVCVYQCFLLTKRICGVDSPEYQEECLRMVQVCYEMGQLDEARDYLGMLQRALEETMPSSKLKPIYYEQCQILYEMRDFERAHREIDKLISLFDENSSLDYSASLALRAAIYSEQGLYDEAIEFKTESIRLKEAILGPDHVEVLTAQKALLTLKKARSDSVQE